LSRKAVVHGHCHHKSLWKMDDEEAILKKLGLDYELPDTGCCGMAGAFGFEGGEHFDVAMKCGERVLLPAVRDADKETLIIADGFSCREQIAQGTDRHALHPAQVIQMALHEGADGPSEAYPEREYIAPPEPEGSAVKTAAAVGMGALLVGAAAWWWNHRRTS
jgi:hypothetical protein